MCDPQNPRPYWPTLWEMLMVHTPTVRQMTAAMVLVSLVRSDGDRQKAAATLGWNERNIRHKSVKAMQDRWTQRLAQDMADEERQILHIRERRRVRERLKIVKATMERRVEA